MWAYLHGSIFLPYLNNEKTHSKSEMSKQRFTDINKLLLAQFAYDTVVQPKGSEYFGARDINGKDVPME